MLKRLYKFLYSLYALKLSYSLDKEAKHVYIDKNKPTSALTSEEGEKLTNMMTHFSNQGYFVNVKGK